MVVITAELHSTKPELRFFVGSNPACGVSEIRNSLDLWQRSRLEIKLNTFRRSTIPQKQFIFIITSPKCVKTLSYFKSLCIIFMLNCCKYFEQKIKQFNQKCFNIFRLKYVRGGKIFQFPHVVYYFSAIRRCISGCAWVPIKEIFCPLEDEL